MIKLISSAALLFATMTLNMSAHADIVTDLYDTPDIITSTPPDEQIITAYSWIVADEKGAIIQESNSDQIRSIASISKLVTAMIVLDANQDLNKKINVRIHRHNFVFTRKQLLQMALVRSDNSAADALCNNYTGGRNACISAMNKKVADLGLINTHFDDPTGLNKHNVSTAKELVTVVMTAQNYPEIVEAASTNTFNIKVSYKSRKHRRSNKTLAFRNTNHDAGSENGIYHFIVSKTGTIRAAGACIVMMVDVANVGKRIVVLLGSKNTHTRVPEAEYIASNTRNSL